MKKHILTLGLSRDDYALIKEDIEETNLRMLKLLTSIGCILFPAMALFTFFSAAFRGFRPVFFAAAALCMLLYPFRPCFGRSLTFRMYAFIMAILLMSAVQGTYFSPCENAVTFVAYLLMVPLLFIDRPVRMMSAVFSAVIFFIALAVPFKDPGFRIVDITDAVIFGFVSALLSVYISGQRAERFLFERRAVLLSQWDILTGLYNRNMFEKIRASATDGCDASLACIYIDVNGLHELNNSEGHDEGDVMLIKAASALKSVFGSECSYRIGGDEFVALLPDIPEKNVMEKVNTLRSITGKEGINISIGVSFTSKDDRDTYTLIKTAEKKMYEEKERYYEMTGRTCR